MASYKKLEIKRFPRVSQQDNKETKFWDKFIKSPIIAKDFAAVTNIDFSPAEPHDYAVTSGSRVQIYSCYTNQIKKTISRFKQTASCARYRHDGKLIAAGGDEGIVRVFDLNSRVILRQFKGHAKPVKCVDFTSDGVRLVSGSDDTTVRLWDMATEMNSLELREHEDYIRCLRVNPSDTNVALTGSYDHTVRVWDLRTQASTLTLDHGAPVESLLVFPSGISCISAGGNYIKVWDLLNGGKLIAAFSNHQKTITSIAFDGHCHRLLSGGLDRQLKVYNVENYQVVHNINYPSPILSVGMSPSDSHVVVGMTTRLLSIRHRPHKESADNSLSFSFRPSQPHPGTYRYFMRGKDYRPADDDYKVPVGSKKRLKSYDMYLRKFKFKKALDAALTTKPLQPPMVYSVLQELARMERLHSAIAGRSEEEMLPLLQYLRRHLTNPRYTAFLIDVCNIVLDIYEEAGLDSPQVKKHLSGIRAQIQHEIRFQMKAFELMGVVETIMASASLHGPMRDR